MMTRQGFPRHERLLHSRDFHNVFNNTQGKSTDQFLTLLATQNNCGHPRLGLAVSKKKIKTAVDRNRIKRLIRNSFRCHKTTLSSIDIVVIGQPKAASVPNHEIYRCLEKHWKRLASKCGN